VTCSQLIKALQHCVGNDGQLSYRTTAESLAIARNILLCKHPITRKGTQGDGDEKISSTLI